jgi:hypothetical protein
LTLSFEKTAIGKAMKIGTFRPRRHRVARRAGRQPRESGPLATAITAVLRSGSRAKIRRKGASDSPGVGAGDPNCRSSPLPRRPKERHWLHERVAALMQRCSAENRKPSGLRSAPVASNFRAATYSDRTAVLYAAFPP